MVMLIYPAVKWYGLEGAAVSAFIAMALSFVLQIFRLRSMIGFELRRYSTVFATALWSLIPVGVTFMVTANIRSLPLPAYLCAGLLACFFAYFLAFRSQLKSLSQWLRNTRQMPPTGR
jgi:O-antigen/teichoic acid export membrane protein